jgi:agmatine deiminase
MQTTPRDAHLFQPAEWAPHSACWLAWPSHGELWEDNLVPAQKEFAALCQAIAEGESLEILVPNAKARIDAERALAGLPVRFHDIPFGDIWMRDTACIFLTDDQGQLANVRFGFNGWGGKYVLPYDSAVSAKVAAAADMRTYDFPWILEGGSIDVDGQGTALTTRQCLLNPNRNPKMNQQAIEEGLRDSLGIEKTLWLGDGLLNDHTDGHIDTLARFIAPGVVACMKATDAETDPNHEVFEAIARDLASFTDARGRPLEVKRVASPGRILNEEGVIMPASYMNFYIGNATVVVPTYGVPQDDEAVRAIASFFPGRRTVGSSAFAILSGGGAFHCITQQQPRGSRS